MVDSVLKEQGWAVEADTLSLQSQNYLLAVYQKTLPISGLCECRSCNSAVHKLTQQPWQQPTEEDIMHIW